MATAATAMERNAAAGTRLLLAVSPVFTMLLPLPAELTTSNSIVMVVPSLYLINARCTPSVRPSIVLELKSTVPSGFSVKSSGDTGLSSIDTESIFLSGAVVGVGVVSEGSCTSLYGDSCDGFVPLGFVPVGSVPVGSVPVGLVPVGSGVVCTSFL